MSEIKLTKDNFETEVIKSDKPVLVDFWATWCGPCMMIAPIVEQISNEHPEIKVGKVNVDEEPELANMFRISSIPTLLLIKEGKVVKTSLGYKQKEQLEKLLQ